MLFLTVGLANIGLYFMIEVGWAHYDDIFNPIMGANAGKITLPEFFPGHEHLVVLIFGVVVTLITIVIPKRICRGYLMISVRINNSLSILEKS